MYEEKYNIKVDMTFTAMNTSDDGRYESVGDGETSSASEDTRKEKITETTTEKAIETDEETEEPDYVIPYSSDRYLTNDDLVGLSSEELMYARNGYIFNDAEIRAYFEKKPWYTGTVKSEDFSSSVFNDYEYKNVTFLKKHQDGEHTGHSAESE